MKKFVPTLVAGLVWLATIPVSRGAEPRPSLSAWFINNPGWTAAGDVTLSADGKTLVNEAGGDGAIWYHSATSPRGPQLKIKGFLGDAVVHLEFMVDPQTEAGLYLEGRYRIQLASNTAGALAPLAETNEPGSAREGKAALANAAGAPGVWQTLDVKFRGPRFDDARNKKENGLLIEVKLNGKVVQSNTIAGGWSEGSEMPWEDAFGPQTIGVEKGSLAIRNFSARRVDFDAVKIPARTGGTTNYAKLVDLVKQGEDNFHSFGCIECHAVQKGDYSAKTGPNLFGLLTIEPRDRVVVSGAEGHRFTVKADHAYLFRSIRTPQEELAVSEHGPNLGQAYPPVMPPFLPAIISDAQIEAIGSYLATLNDVHNQGPVIRLVEEAGVKNYDPMADRLQFLVDRTVRIQRGPMEHVSGRSIHVGQPNGINYTFDPRVLAVVQVWQGGFLDMSGEFLNRGGKGLKFGYQSREIDLGPPGVLLAPLNAKGQLIDFSFKDAKFQDGATIREALYSAQDHLDRLAAIDAQFLGYERDSRSPDAAPIFKYRVGRNTIALQTQIAADGKIRMLIDGKFAEPQTFALNVKELGNVKVSLGELHDDRWVVPTGTHQGIFAEGKLTVAANLWHAKPSTFSHRKQPLVTEPSQPSLPLGYSAESYLGPKDNYGRDQLFEALGLAVAPDGTLVVATRTAGVWRLVKGEWQLFAEGLFDSLGVQIEDEHGLKLVVGQKAELTRITDTNGDGMADTFETLTDAFTYHGNYHSYMHGPVRDANGDYIITLNLDDAGQLDYEYRAGGKYMGTGGGYRGWAIRVPAKGGFEPYANGMRSPAGLGLAPDGRLWYLDNQGEYMGTSKLFVLKKGLFYGHPAGLVDLPGMTPDSPEIAWTAVAERREMPVVLFPENRLANSPGNPAWDTTDGKFGPFAGQMFVGDQTQSNLLRVVTEQVGEHEQGAAISFGTKFESGVMRPIFLPDHSLLLGETGRGWQSKGGHIASLQHITWDGKTIPPGLHHVSAIAGGFELVFTVPIPERFTEKDLSAALAIQSWVYRDAADYGSPEMDDHAEAISSVQIPADRKSLRVMLAKTDQPKLHPQQTARVYRITLAGETIWGKGAGPGFDAFYTLYQFPGTSAALK